LSTLHPSARSLVIDRNTHKIEKWKLDEAGTNFPMALDEEHHRLLVAARRPARMLVLNTDSGKVIASLPGAADKDDMAYDATRRRIYVPSGEGLSSSISKLILTDTSVLPKFLARLGHGLARTTAKLEDTTAFTLLFQGAPTEVRNYGFTKRAIEQLRSSTDHAIPSGKKQ